ncbi:serine/threonine kinase motif-containing protein [Pandoravirus inopinatum]|uniref:Serine/threonine kinase motif-containing protein n=1 Tax=Pandoravirus inopinatum TaxID=1605721 RepID=A0A0B5JCD6_9VIRU|nr:serine/threonine kinase motif-containing protein [Pandoravirus inopinatum]AJF97272.1 serine/threonine kinase motif-containing protein [Pandoravirus inopinatum]
MDTYDALSLRSIPYNTGVTGLSNLEDPNTWPVVGLVTAVLRTDAIPPGYDCQYAEAALDFLAWLEINDGALAATLASRGLVPLSSNFRQRATDMMGAISLCASFSSSSELSGDMVPSSTLFNATTETDSTGKRRQDTRTTTGVTAAATGTTRVAAAALVGAGTTSLVWSGWMQAYASRVGAASAARLKLAEDGEDEAISRLALYGVDFAVTSAGATDLTPVLAAACVDCMSVPMAVRPYAAIYNVPEIARAGCPCSWMPTSWPASSWVASTCGTTWTLWQPTRRSPNSYPAARSSSRWPRAVQHRAPVARSAAWPTALPPSTWRPMSHFAPRCSTDRRRR